MNRDDFPLLKKKIHGHPLIYFDTAATAQKPLPVIEAIQDFYMTSYGTVHRAVYELSRAATTAYQEVRKNIQTFLGAKYPEEIIFTRGTTASLNLVAASFSKAFLKPGDVILISEVEHHSNVVPWQMAASQSGAILKAIPVDDKGELCLSSYRKLLTENVKIVSVAHVSNALGTLHPLSPIIEEAHRVGAKVCIDGAQSAGHFPIDVQKLEVDFYAFSSHKMYGPTGIGVLYGKKELLREMPPIEGGGDMIETVTLSETRYAPLPLKFEAGTPMIAEAIGLNAAYLYLKAIGLDKIAAYEHGLTSYALERLSALDKVKIVPPCKTRGSLISFIIENVHPLDVGTLLDCRGIAIRTGHLCSQPAMKRFGLTSTCRISFGLYNTSEEVDEFILVLQEVIRKLSPT